MSWLYYLLEANLYLVLFYGFYRLFLQNETFYNLNRYFLLCATVISFALPILQIGLLKLSTDPNFEHITEVSPRVESVRINWFYIFYLLVAVGLAIKLCKSIYKIVSISLEAKKHIAGDITLVELNGDITAFSFFNLLFIHPELANQPTVLKHEMVHIKQKHSFDVMFFELVQIICWFNPILPFLKKDIKLLHEYIADELTTAADVQKHDYALFLIQNSFGLNMQPITNQIFNQSILKRRINMLNKKRTEGRARLRLLLALPLTGAMLCTSTMAFTKDYGYVDLLPEKSKTTNTVQKNPKVKEVDTPVKFPPPIVKPDKPRKVVKDQVKFPPPVVKPDKPAQRLKTPPPPPVEPATSRKRNQVKFPPPIVRPDKPAQRLKTPPPPVEPEGKVLKIELKEKPATPKEKQELQEVEILNLKVIEENPKDKSELKEVVIKALPRKN